MPALGVITVLNSFLVVKGAFISSNKEDVSKRSDHPPPNRAWGEIKPHKIVCFAPPPNLNTTSLTDSTCSKNYLQEEKIT